MTDRPKLLLLITELQMGGAARVFRDHARAFAPHFHVHEAVFDEGYGLDFAGDQRPISLDRGQVSRGPFRPLLNLVRRVRRLRKIKRDLGIQVCISHLEGAHYVDILSCRGEKTILCVHGSTVHNRMIAGRSGWLRRRLLIPWLYNRADRIVTVSRDLVPELVALGVAKEKIRTINNFFEIDAIAEAAREPLEAAEAAIFADPPVIVASGRLHQQKNLLAMLGLFAAIRRQRPCRLVWLGDGPLRRAMVECATSLGLATWDAATGTSPVDADVYLLGNRTNPFKYLARSTLFVLPSLWEGFPLALCEAMACGVPVVAADCPTGPREILEPDGSGLLLPMLDDPRAASEWSDAIIRLLDDPSERHRLIEAGSRRVRDFTPDKIVPQWLRLIRKVLDAQ